MSLGWGDRGWGENGWGGALATSGVSATGSVGTVASDRAVALSGVGASGLAGDVTETNSPTEDSTTANGFVGDVGSSRTIALTGVGGAGAAGTVTHGKTLGLTGNLASGQVGTVSRGETLLALIGVTATGQISAPGVSRDTLVSGVNGEGAAGSVVQSFAVGVSGVFALGLVSQVIVPIGLDEAVGEVGTVINVRTIALTGVSAQGIAGAASVGPRVFAVTGVAARGATGDVIAVYWKPIDDTQNPNWQNVNNAQASNWQVIQT